MKHYFLFLIISFLLGSCCSLLRIPTFCPPDSDFSSDKSVILENESVQFMDQSYGDPESWNWSFPGGTPTSSSSQNPRITYSMDGTYPVSLTIRNRYGTDTEEKLSFIAVKNPIECNEITFTPGPYTRLCPSHIGGDREFAGHGPNVTASAQLRIVDEKRIFVDLHLHEKETRSDWTECLGNWTYLVYTAPGNWQIQSILTDISSTTSYRDTDHDLDRPPVSGGRLVSIFEIMGDTGGNDVGNCTDDDAYLNVYFNEVRVKICRDTD